MCRTLHGVRPASHDIARILTDKLRTVRERTCLPSFVVLTCTCLEEKDWVVGPAPPRRFPSVQLTCIVGSKLPK